MKNLHPALRISSTFGLMLMLCCLPFAVYAKDKKDNGKDKKQGISYEADIDYPVFEKEQLLNAQVSDIVQKNLEAFNNEFFSAEAPAYPQAFEFDMDSSSVYEDANHISFLLNVYQFTGGAHGTTSLIPVTYSKQTKKLLSLEEAVQPTRKDWLSALSTEARKQLNDQVKKQTFVSDEDWINKGTEPSKENFSVFKLEKNAVRIIFSQYQVGPYSSGMPEIVVPRSLFK
ncbi:DUF3298 and DUF4163 domain-containing protein [Treponema vincentii]|uniref:DUF3298 and DUF4163 domain-containing protein n=1 Tax=Treponema vincentii TaxID=69710 RepID=UPI0020A2D20C|nr:DUF3298 and DUF4163 domain-containing protein [Treponema vincentii]UTC45526.1 DUF3298 and DUF4163 domain-containing protein [Treponema vincentii]UTC60519.1 DUF3298 and DUF4163 domain-containing protein [Treponema vincentii]